MSRVMDPAAAVDYPYSDGRPMAESEAHLRAMLYLVGALYGHFRDRPDVYVGADMFIYHERGNPAAVVAPDVFVVLGAAKRTQDRRLSYKLWEEPKGPDFVLEVASRRTWAADRDKKRALYARLGVGEYWLYDPTGERIRSRLRAMRLEAGGYREVVPEAAALEGRYLRSAVLGLEVRVDGAGELHVRNPVTGDTYLMPEEEHVARLAEAGGPPGRGRGPSGGGGPGEAGGFGPHRRRGAGGGASGAAARAAGWAHTRVTGPGGRPGSTGSAHAGGVLGNEHARALPAYNERARRRYSPPRDRGSIRVEGATHRATCRRGAMKRYELPSIIGTILAVGIALGTVMITSD